MIPNIQPPPVWLPQGWTPNALRPTAAQIATDVIAEQTTIINAITQVNAITLANSALLNGTGVKVGTRTFAVSAAELRAITVGDFTTMPIVIPAEAGIVFLPIAAIARICVVNLFAATVSASFVYGAADLDSYATEALTIGLPLQLTTLGLKWATAMGRTTANQISETGTSPAGLSVRFALSGAVTGAPDEASVTGVVLYMAWTDPALPCP